MLTDNVTAIVVAAIGAIGGVYAVVLSRRSDKSSKTITKILSNTKSPVESLDQVILVLQRELAAVEKRRETERDYMQAEIEELREELVICRKAREQFYKDLEKLQNSDNRRENKREEVRDARVLKDSV